MSDYFEPAVAIVGAAHAMAKAGRLGSVLDGIRTETESEVLDQAEHLRGKGYLVAATVLAGGALETHLRFLCNKHRIPFAGSGSISAYNDAIAQHRNQGNEIYSASDGKSVTAWGGLRNDAAHDPTSFSKSKETVETMILGIRDFIGRSV